MNDDDKRYTDASGLAVGATLAGMYKGLIDGGVPRSDALAIVLSYVAGMAVGDSDHSAPTDKP